MGELEHDVPLPRSNASNGTPWWVGLQNPHEGSVPWVKVWDGPEHVLFGHDARRKLQETCFATGLDTGCCYGNFLSALLVDPDDASQRKLVQIPAEVVHCKPKSAH